MPYTVISNAEGCSGYAVVKEGETVPVPGGCHALKSDAIVHMVALQYQYMEEEIEEEDEEEEESEEEEEERQAPNLVAPAFMKASARRGLRLHEEGFSGDGLKPQTVADARKMSEGTALSEDKWRRIAPWIARHIVDLDAVQGDEITAGLVAMLLWGGGSSKSSARRAQAYAERIVAQLDEKRYDPDQPRDEDGKFGSGGGSSDGGDEEGMDEYDEDEFFKVDEEEAEQAQVDVLDEQQDYLRSLDDASLQAIEGYSEDGHDPINRILRGAPPPPPTDEEYAEWSFATTELEKIVSEAPPLPEGTTVYRGISAKALGLESFDPENFEAIVGDSFTDKGIISTTFSPEVAQSFTRNDIILEIEIGEGTRGLAVDTLSSSMGEKELLLPPGTAFDIVGLRQVDDYTVFKVVATN